VLVAAGRYDGREQCRGVVVVSDAGTVRSALFVMNKNKKRMNLSQSPPESLSCLFPIVWPRRRNAGKATAEGAFFCAADADAFQRAVMRGCGVFVVRACVRWW